MSFLNMTSPFASWLWLAGSNNRLLSSYVMDWLRLLFTGWLGALMSTVPSWPVLLQAPEDFSHTWILSSQIETKSELRV